MKIFKRTPLTEEQKKSRKRQRILCVASGLMLGLSFPPVPFPAPLLLFAALIPYFKVISEKDKLIDMNRITYLMAFFFNLIAIYWVGGWGSETDPFLMISGLLLMFINPVFFLIPSTLYYFASKLLDKRKAFYLFPFFFVFYEYLYMITDASFPWVTIGNGLAYFNRFIQIADIIGVLGLSLIVLFVNVFLYIGMVNFRDNKRTATINLSAALMLFIVPLMYGNICIASYKIPSKNIKVGLVQPNLNPWDKWSGSGLEPLMKNYMELSDKAVKNGAELVIWPETALPVYLTTGLYRSELDSIFCFTTNKDFYLLTGMPDFRFYRDNETAPGDAKYSPHNQRYYSTFNSVMLFSPGKRFIDSYGKMKLVPFGERVPFVDRLPFLGNWIKWGVGISGWNVGRDTIVFKIIKKGSFTDTVKINALVCFESVFPDFVSSFSRKGAQMIAVVTNDSWYGNSSGPYQHKAFAALRAVENRRSVVRAANGGISAIIDPLGRTVAESKMYTRTLITGYVPLETELTFYTKHPLIIPYISLILSAVTLGIYTRQRIRRAIKQRVGR